MLTKPLPSASASAAASTSTPPVATETVERPAPGLARGVWEAPPAFFYVAGAVACLAAIAWVLARRGFFGRARDRVVRAIRG